MSTILNELSDALSAVRHASTHWSSALDAIERFRAQLATRRKARMQAAQAPIPIEDVRRRIPVVVDQLRERFIADARAELLITRSALASPSLKRATQVQLPMSLRAWLGPMAAARPADAEAALMAIFEALGPYPAGARLDERTELVAAMDAELREMEHAEELAVDDAQAAGIAIKHRPDVQQRRDQEARARELEERAEHDRLRRQAEIEASYGAPADPIGGPSRYITTGGGQPS